MLHMMQLGPPPCPCFYADYAPTLYYTSAWIIEMGGTTHMVRQIAASDLPCFRATGEASLGLMATLLGIWLQPDQCLLGGLSDIFVFIA